MTVVLKENEWAHDMIERNELGNKPSETLRRVADIIWIKVALPLRHESVSILF